MTTDDELGAELRRDLQSTFVPFDEARAAEMIDVATEAELVSARRYWAAPAAAAAAVVAVGGTAAVLAAGHDGGGTPAGGDPTTTSSPTTRSEPVLSWSCTYPIKVKGKLGFHLKLVPVQVQGRVVLPGATAAPTGETGAHRLPILTAPDRISPGATIVLGRNSAAGHTITCRLTKVASPAVPTSVDTVPPAPTSVPSGSVTGTPAAPSTGRPGVGETVTTTVPAPPRGSTSAPAMPTAPLSLPGTPTS